MKIVQEQPPIRIEADKVFRLPPGAIFTYGDVIYNPSGNPIDLPLYKHEEVHSKQQGDTPDIWWVRYLNDNAFRISQEIPAYQAQYKEAKKYIKDRNQLASFAMALAKDLSSAMYGNAIDFQTALKKIRHDT